MFIFTRNYYKAEKNKIFKKIFLIINRGKYHAIMRKINKFITCEDSKILLGESGYGISKFVEIYSLYYNYISWDISSYAIKFQKKN